MSATTFSLEEEVQQLLPAASKAYFNRPRTLSTSGYIYIYIYILYKNTIPLLINATIYKYKCQLSRPIICYIYFDDMNEDLVY